MSLGLGIGGPSPRSPVVVWARDKSCSSSGVEGASPTPLLRPRWSSPSQPLPPREMRDEDPGGSSCPPHTGPLPSPGRHRAQHVLGLSTCPGVVRGSGGGAREEPVRGQEAPGACGSQGVSPHVLTLLHTQPSAVHRNVTTSLSCLCASAPQLSTCS